MFPPLAHFRSKDRVIAITKESYHAAESDSFTAVEIASEFLSSTSIHGMKYVGQSNRHFFERMCWSCFVILGLVGSVYSCYLEWCKWQTSPLLITQDPTIASHEPLNFPVVTLCSTHKLSDEKIKLVLQNPKYSWMNSTFLLKTLRYVLKFDASMNQEDELNRIGAILSQHEMDIDDLIEIVGKTSLTCAELFLDCLWQSKVLPCDKLFTPILTDDGICCSLRDVSKSLIQTESNAFIGLQKNASFFADAVHEYGVHSALRIVLDAKNSDSSLVVSMFDGFKVLLHNEKDFPDVMKRGFVVAAGFDHYIALNAMSVYYTPAIPAIPFERRECYVEGEGKLKYYGTYTRSACLYECRIDVVLEKCGCLPYFIEIKAPNNQSIPKCPLEAYPCVATIYGKGHVTTMGGQTKCHCPGTCKDQWFTTEISAVPFSIVGMSSSRLFRRITKTRNVTATSFVRNLVGLRIFFRYNSGDSYKMDVPYGTKELIASCGGLLSLGLGFSVISAVELIYFLCIRCCFRKTNTTCHESNNAMTYPGFTPRYSIERPAYRKEPYFINPEIDEDKAADWIRVLAPGGYLKSP